MYKTYKTYNNLKIIILFVLIAYDKFGKDLLDIKYQRKYSHNIYLNILRIY